MLDRRSFRSPFLAPRPAAPAASRNLRRRRWTAAGIAFGAFLLGYFQLPPSAPGSVVYRLHDHVYLPLKGYLFTLFYPWSFLLWGPLAAAALYLLASTLASRPLSAGRHVRAVRGFLARPWPCGWLRSRSERSKSPRRLLAAVVQRQCDAALARLDADPGNADAYRDAVRLSSMEVAPYHRRPDQIPAAICRLNEVLLRGLLGGQVSLTDFDRQRSARRNRDGDVLIDTLRKLQLKLPEQETPNGPWDLQALVRGLNELLAAQGGSGVPSAELIDEISDRRSTLDQGRRLFETQLWQVHPERRRSIADAFERLGLVHGNYRLALDVALIAAWRARAPEIALAFLESLEGLRFLADEPTRLDLSALRATSLATPLDYRVCAWMLTEEHDKSETGTRSRARLGGVLREPDLELMNLRIAQLKTAGAACRRE